MKKTGFVIGGLGLQGGAAALVLYFLNMIVWSIATAMAGGGLALIGLGLIFWALYPRRGTAAVEATADDAAETVEAEKMPEGEAVPA